MLAVLETFECEYDGKVIRLEAGRSQVAEDNEIVRRHPEKFGPVPPRGYGRRRPAGLRRGGGSAAAPSPAGRLVARPRPSPPPARKATLAQDERELPELRPDETSPITLQLSSRAHTVIRDEIAYSRGMLETGAETGGWLFGRREGRVRYLTATRLGSNGRRQHERVKHDYAEAEAEAERMRLAEASMWFAGTWHTHPYVDHGLPSSTDRQGALWQAAWRELNAAPNAVSLILTPDRDRGWSRPVFHAWVTRRNQFGTAVTEPATIVAS